MRHAPLTGLLLVRRIGAVRGDGEEFLLGERLLVLQANLVLAALTSSSVTGPCLLVQALRRYVIRLAILSGVSTVSCAGMTDALKLAPLTVTGPCRPLSRMAVSRNFEPCTYSEPSSGG